MHKFILMILLGLVEGALSQILFGIVLNDSGQLKTGYLSTLNGSLVMVYGNGDYTFEQGVDLYNTGLSKIDQGDDEGARNDFNDAKNIFIACSENPQAAKYLKLTEEQLIRLDS